jgi:hypothetical protein
MRRAQAVRVTVPTPYVGSPYPSQFVSRYPRPLFVYAAPPPVAHYYLGYRPDFHVYRYGYQYPYYVYYVVPWPYGPAGY